MNPPIPITQIKLQYKSEQKDITAQQLKGAFNAYVHEYMKSDLDSAGIPLNIGYNRNEQGKPIQRYPLVQFRTENDMLEIVGIGQGDTVVSTWIKYVLKANNFQINGKDIALLYPEINTQHWYPQLLPQQSKYQIRGWKPFDTETLGNESRLDGIIWGNILRMLSELGIQFSEKPAIHLRTFVKLKPSKGYHINWISYNAVFSSNINLPQHIGIGHEPSIGSGKIWMLK